MCTQYTQVGMYLIDYPVYWIFTYLRLLACRFLNLDRLFAYVLQKLRQMRFTTIIPLNTFWSEQMVNLRSAGVYISLVWFKYIFHSCI